MLTLVIYRILYMYVHVYIGAKKKKIHEEIEKKYIYKKEKKKEQNNYMYCKVKQFMTHTTNIY